MLHTIVRIVLLSFVLQIIIQHFIFLYHSKFLSKRVSRISRDVDDRMGGKSKPQKESLDKKLKPKKILYRTTHHQDYSVKIKPTEKILAKFFLPQKNPGIENFKPKKSFDHRRYLKSGVPPLEFRSTPNFLIESFAYDVLHNRKTDCRIRS